MEDVISNHSQGRHYGVCIGDPGPIIHQDNNLKEVYFWCSCISGSMQAPLLIIDLFDGRVIDSFKLTDQRREV